MREEKHLIFLAVTILFTLFLPPSIFAVNLPTAFNYKYFFFANQSSGYPASFTNILVQYYGTDPQTQIPDFRYFALGYYNNTVYNHNVLIIMQFNSLGQATWTPYPYTVLVEPSHDLTPEGFTQDNNGNLFIGIRDETGSSWIYKFSHNGGYGVINSTATMNKLKNICSDGTNIYAVGNIAVDGISTSQLLVYNNNLIIQPLGGQLSFNFTSCAPSVNQNTDYINVVGYNSTGTIFTWFNITSGLLNGNPYIVPSHAGRPFPNGIIGTADINETTGGFQVNPNVMIFSIDNTTSPNMLYSYTYRPGSVSSNYGNPATFNFCANGCSYNGGVAFHDSSWLFYNGQVNMSFAVQSDMGGFPLQYASTMQNLINQIAFDSTSWWFVGSTPDNQLAMFGSSNPYMLTTPTGSTISGTCSPSQLNNTLGCARCVQTAQGWTISNGTIAVLRFRYDWTPDPTNCASGVQCKLDSGYYGHCTNEDLGGSGCVGTDCTPQGGLPCIASSCPNPDPFSIANGMLNYTLDCVNGFQQLRFCSPGYMCNLQNPSGSCVNITSAISIINGTITIPNPPNTYNITSSNPIVYAFGSPYFYIFLPLLLAEIAILYFTGDQFLSLILFTVWMFLTGILNLIPTWIGYLLAVLGIEIIVLKRDW